MRLLPLDMLVARRELRVIVHERVQQRWAVRRRECYSVCAFEGVWRSRDGVSETEVSNKRSRGVQQ